MEAIFLSNSKATFVDYNMGQLILPMDFSDLIDPHDVSRVVNEMVDLVSDDVFISQYKGGGRSSYHPKMMTKVILYAYTKKIYSCRGIAQALRENLPMMWLSGQQRPDFRTINRFRTERMKMIIEPLFTELIQLLLDQEYITMENYFLDGTKIEANANKYTFVWKKSTERYKEKLQENIRVTLQQIEESIKHDEEYIRQHPEDQDIQPITSSELERIVKRVEDKVDELDSEAAEEKDPVHKKEKKKAFREMRKIHRKIHRDQLPRLAKYEHQLSTFGDRNSYSKTDPDATFMRMKDDHMKNGQLKAGYNIQAGTEGQFIVFYSIHQRPTDTRCFIPHLDQLKTSHLPFPRNVIADAGYGSEGNYLYAHEEEFNALIPYNTLRKEETKAYKKQIRHVNNWEYNEHEDLFICPNQRRILFKHYSKRTDKYGQVRDFKIYESEDCSDCPLKEQCTKAKGNRQVHYNPVYEEMKAKVKNNLWSDRGNELYAQRKIDVESVFGHIKGNRSFRRFHLRGLDKVNIEFGLVAMAHNLLKQAAKNRLFDPEYRQKKNPDEKIKFSHRDFWFNRGFWDSPFITCALNLLLFCFCPNGKQSATVTAVAIIDMCREINKLTKQRAKSSSMAIGACTL
jgi:transposase